MDFSGVDDETWKLLLDRDDFKCLHCNSELNLAPAHYQSRGSGGNDTLDNLMLLCWDCHRKQHEGKLQVIKVAMFDTTNPAYGAYAGFKFFFRKVK